MKYVSLYAWLWLVVFYTSCEGQTKTDLLTETISPQTKDVVTSTAPDNITRTIKQDSKGNIWIAAFDGVYRYDDKSFINVVSEVSSARFFSVLEDRNGNFWFSSVGSGVYYYDGKSFQNFTTKDGLASDQVTDIYEDKTGAIWFATDRGASRYNGVSFQNYRMNEAAPSFVTVATTGGVPKNDHTDVNSILEDKTGKFWFGTRGHASTYDGKSFTMLTHNGKPFTNVRSIIEDKKGAIWLGGADGLWRYDGSRFTNFSQNFVGYIYEDKKGNIWTNSQTHWGWVLSRYEANTLSTTKPTVTEIETKEGKMIFGILEARDGRIWFGALDGVHRYDGTTITNFKR
ncbi:ligand-binding sensor domain-containing protein [Spirosoma pollinicola]|uniref:Histidine kinase n=1 Tax=Spirosoma pollinicola TaxID=2057025 RepID=A0A2K8ZB25_9BACT|nr:two-component regulator propeller domain-containing protein [Spirosoma pollinicola]AUD07082.1 histidine kinase [Spirosoma pollinicola]